jgi:D-alanyl-D-alanine dipeptidase
VGHAGDADDGEANVGAVHAAAVDLQRRAARRLHLLADVGLDSLVGGRRQPEHAQLRVALLQRAQQVDDLPVRRAEVVAPRRDAVRLVDDDHADRQRRERGEAVDVIEVLRRDEQQLDVPAGRGVARRRVLLVGSGRC